MPFIVRWPGQLKPGTSDALVCQIDLSASLAALTDQKLPSDAAPDSFDVLGALLGKTTTGRDSLIEHAGTLSIIQGRWKYIAPSKGAKINRNVNIELGNDPQPQLYDLDNDLGERHNVASEHPGKVKELAAMLEKIKAAGRSRP